MEMNEKNVTHLAALLKKPEADVEKALSEENGIETLVNDFKTNNQVFGLDDFAKLKDNLKKETLSKLSLEDIPETFKNKAIGWKLEKLEEEIKEKYQYDGEFKGLTDLVDKVISKTGNPSDNGEEKAALKKRIVELENEYKEQLTQKQMEFDSTLIKTDFSKALNSLNLDYEKDDVLKKQKGLLKAAFNDVYKVKREDGKTVVLKDDEVVKDKNLEPLTLDEVLLGVAKDYGFQLKTPEPGGHGGKSSKKNAGLSGVSWVEYAEKNGVKPHEMSDKKDKLYSEWKAAQN